MKKLLSVLIAILTIVCCFAVPTFAEEAPERTLTVIEATKDYVKFSYTGAVEGDNSWVGVYDAYAEISPEHHEEISIYYIYLAPGDGEYTLEYAKAGRVGEVEADSNPGTMLKNTNDNALLGDLSDYKIIWLGGESWYENFCEAPLVPAERTLTVIEATKDYVKFSYTGAVEGDNNWVGIYDAYAEISPEHHEEISVYYIYIASGDGEYTLEFAKAGRVGEVADDAQPGTMMKNTNDNSLLGDLSDYKLIWLAGESWYETVAEAPLVEEADTTAPTATDSSADNTSKPNDTSKPADTTGSTSGENNDGWVLPVVIVAAVVIVVAVVVIIVKKNKK